MNPLRTIKEIETGKRLKVHEIPVLAHAWNIQLDSFTRHNMYYILSIGDVEISIVGLESVFNFLTLLKKEV